MFLDDSCFGVTVGLGIEYQRYQQMSFYGVSEEASLQVEAPFPPNWSLVSASKRFEVLCEKFPENTCFL